MGQEAGVWGPLLRAAARLLRRGCVLQGSQTDGAEQETAELLLLERTRRRKWPSMRVPAGGGGREPGVATGAASPHFRWTDVCLPFSAQAARADSGHRKHLASTPTAGKRADKGSSLGFSGEGGGGLVWLVATERQALQRGRLPA